MRTPARSGNAQSFSSMAQASSRGMLLGQVQQAEGDGMLVAEEPAVGDPEDQRVADPARGAGDRDANRVRLWPWSSILDVIVE